MESKRGIPVSPGVAIGPALVLDTEGFRIPQRFVEAEELDAELLRLRHALAAAARDSRQNQQAVSEKLGAQYGAIFGAHALLIEDAALSREIETLIREQHFATEYAVSRVIRRYAKALESIDQGQLAGRVADLFDIERSVLGHLLGERREQLRDLKQPVVVLAHDLTPSETAALDPRMVHAFATEAGGRASHTAIMAGALEIPAVVGLGKFLNDVSGGDLIIVDGNHGVVILDPDEETLALYESSRKDFRKFEDRLGELRDLPAQTRDGVRISLL
ncbi:MAG TPA: phosphoenolpyruvate-utilizing N-terminal domain-containing protein, partial [Gemmataceae bacterium]